MADYISLYQSIATKTVQSLQGGVTIPVGLMSKQRALGDAVEGAIVERFAEICAEFSSEVQVKFSNRALEDVAFRYDGRYFAVDVKTHNLDARFSMPNLISVDRLLRFYDDPDNYFVLAMVKYRVISPGQADNQLAGVGIEEVVICDIEHIAWQSLTIGALGTGQLQIKDARKLTLNPEGDRKTWFRELLIRLAAFYEHEITKNGKRLEQVQRRLAEQERLNMSDYAELYQNIAADMVKPEPGDELYHRPDARKYIDIEIGFRRLTPTAAIEEELTTRLAKACAEYADKMKDSLSKAALENVGFYLDGNYFALGLRTRRVTTKASIMEVVEVDRLMRLYDTATNYFVIALVDYELTYSTKQEWGRLFEIRIDDVTLTDVEHLDWHSLSLSEGGKGELQLKLTGKTMINPLQNRQSWLRELYTRLRGYYDAEMKKSAKKLEQVQRRLAELESRGLA